MKIDKKMPAKNRKRRHKPKIRLANGLQDDGGI